MTAVGIDVSAVPADPRGAGRYTVELVRALAARGQVELSLETRKSDGERWRELAPASTVHPVVPDARWRRLAWEQIAAPRFVDRWPIDVFHGPHYTMPEIARRPKVVTIHDLTFFDHPEWHEKVKVSFFSRAVRVAAVRSDALICVSEATARRLQELVEVDAPVHVVAHGIDHGAFRPDDPDGRDAAELAELGITRPYVAFVGTLEPRKNVAGLVAAFDLLAPERPDLSLVIAGGSGWGNHAFEQAVEKSPHGDRIRRTGYVDDRAVPAIMRGASVVVYPAFEEGFGLPVLESLACGTAAVTTAGSVMDEIAEGAAFTVPAASDADLATAIATALDDEGERNRRRRLGLEVAARHTWDASAAGHEQVYRSVAR